MSGEDWRKHYVAGFAFDPSGDRVVLIEKSRPTWQAGLLNGVGGHVERGETPTQAMRREFREEAGLDVDRWEVLLSLEGDGWIVHFFRAIGVDVDSARTTTDERTWVVDDWPLLLSGGKVVSRVGGCPRCGHGMSQHFGGGPCEGILGWQEPHRAVRCACAGPVIRVVPNLRWLVPLAADASVRAPIGTTLRQD